ncbi:MAG: PilZ domain-containing protein [Methylophaga sp.]|nr:PilZ domain-containing protein [Methylophaga sp.]
MDHEEKRQFQRMRLNSQLQFRRIGETRLYKGETLDLSATGIRFITTEPLIHGETLQIVINSQHQQITPLVAEGKVLRAEALNETTDSFEVSLLFTELN